MKKGFSPGEKRGKSFGKLTKAWHIYRDFSRSAMIPASENLGPQKFGLGLSLLRF